MPRIRATMVVRQLKNSYEHGRLLFPAGGPSTEEAKLCLGTFICKVVACKFARAHRRLK
jgi:hypothetical protein